MWGGIFIEGTELKEEEEGQHLPREYPIRERTWKSETTYIVYFSVNNTHTQRC
jgi:hypothetical protein